ncbi:HIR complex subunit [Coemansia erecta]|nr:HIR complex subunit [Coemansia erecta]
MRIIKPEWLRHDADKKKLTAIFSLDFHPDGTRLATAGMDNKIRLWSTPSITKTTTKTTATATDTAEPRLLSTLTAHSGAVMCVRFSHNKGRYLASGADDMVVLIWEKDSEVSTGNLTNLSGGPAPTETWHPLRRLTGHESDVCDIAWSPDNRYLATCGLDNVIFIWDARTFERIKKITGHSQFVKGLAFDPAGRFLASQSDDKTMKIWRTSDWGLHKTVSKPFEENIFFTYFRRPSWSPDGECIATANAANGKVPVAAIIGRDSWSADLSFVGHRAAIEAVRFNPRVFNVPSHEEHEEEEEEENSRYKMATICAAGGQDRGITVWLTSQHMPIAAATNLFSGNLMDLAWYTIDSDPAPKDPQTVVALLAACSYDGTVALLEFTQQELGTPIAMEEQEGMLKKYGWVKRTLLGKRARTEDHNDDADDDIDTAGHRPKPLVESVEQLKLEQQGAVLSRVPQESRLSQLMDGMAPGENEATRELIREKEGKEENEISAASMAGSGSGSGDTNANANANSNANANANANNAAPVMPTPVRTKDGKKRVAPLFVRPLGGCSAGSSTNTTTNTTGQSRGPAVQQQNESEEMKQPAMAFSSTTVTAAIEHERVDAPLWIEARVLGTRQMRSAKTTTSSNATNGANTENSETSEKAPTATTTTGGYVLGPQSLIHAQSISAARVHLMVPKIVAQLSSTAGRAGGKPRAIAYNNTQVSRLVCNKSAGASWTKHFGHAITMISSSDRFTAATLSDGSLHLFDALSGTRLFPAIMNEAHPAYLQCHDKFCLLLDSVGQLTIWDLNRMQATMDHVSVAPLLYSAELSAPDRQQQWETSADGDDSLIAAPKRHRATVALTSVKLLETTGAPLLVLSDGRSFTFHSQMRSWIRLYGPQDHQLSDHFFRPLSSPPPQPSSSSNGKTTLLVARNSAMDTPMGLIQEQGFYQAQATLHANNSKKKPPVPSFLDTTKLSSDAATRKSVTLDHIEYLLGSSATIGAKDDVVRYLDVLAKLLARNGDIDRVSFWLDYLLGPPLLPGLSSPDSVDCCGSWAFSMAGIPKRQLLERMLPILATNRNLQTLVTEYSTTLKKLLEKTN